MKTTFSALSAARSVAFKPSALAGLTLSAFLASGGWLMGAQPAGAEIIAISGTSLVARCPCDGGSEADEFRGVLQPQVKSRYFASVSLPNGQSVCSFSLVYRDVNEAEGMRAYLMKKAFVVGRSAAGNPVTMAKVASAAGVVETVRKATDTTISDPVITNASAFYFVRADVDNVNIEILGVQIDVRPSCG